MMTARKQILWIDNDRKYLHPYHIALENNGYLVRFANSVSEGERALNASQFDLLILDVMIPTSEEDERSGYTSSAIELGHSTGLIFYQRNRDLLMKLRVRTMVLTVRVDQNIKNAFLASGLPSHLFFTKSRLVRVSAFVDAVQGVLG